MHFLYTVTFNEDATDERTLEEIRSKVYNVCLRAKMRVGKLFFMHRIYNVKDKITFVCNHPLLFINHCLCLNTLDCCLLTLCWLTWGHRVFFAHKLYHFHLIVNPHPTITIYGP